jgi:hypothetical protein
MNTPVLSVFAALAFTAASANAATLIKNFSTGYDDATNVQLGNGVADSDWAIAPGGTAGSVGATLTAQSSPLPGSYIADNASLNSRWIVIPSGAGSFGTEVNPGTYLFQTNVTLLPTDNALTTGIAQLKFAADDNVLDVSINGTSVFTHSDCGCSFYADWTTLNCVGVGLFQTGNNTITFTVKNNSADPNPMAFRAEGSVAVDACPSTSVPEPASLGLLGGGALGLLTRRRRK